MRRMTATELTAVNPASLVAKTAQNTAPAYFSPAFFQTGAAPLPPFGIIVFTRKKSSENQEKSFIFNCLCDIFQEIE